MRESGKQPVEEADEVVPDRGSGEQLVLVGLEGRPPEVPALYRGLDPLGGEPRRVHRDAHAGGEDRIDEASRVPDREPAVAAHAVQLVAVVQESRPRRRLRQGRISTERREEELVDVQLGLLVGPLVGDEPDRGDLLVDRGLPGPPAQLGNEVDVRVAAGPAPAAVHVDEPGVKPELVEHRMVAPEVQLTAEAGGPTARVHHHLGGELHRGSSHGGVNAAGGVSVEEDALHEGPLDQLAAEALGVLHEEEVELGAVHVIRVVLQHAFLRELAVRDLDGLPVTAVVDDSARAREPRGLDDVVEADLSQDPHRGRHEGLAYVRPRVVLPLEDEAWHARLGQVAPQGEAGRTAPDDHDIGHAQSPVVGQRSRRARLAICVTPPDEAYAIVPSGSTR